MALRMGLSISKCISRFLRFGRKIFFSDQWPVIFYTESAAQSNAFTHAIAFVSNCLTAIYGQFSTVKGDSCKFSYATDFWFPVPVYCFVGDDVHLGHAFESFSEVLFNRFVARIIINSVNCDGVLWIMALQFRVKLITREGATPSSNWNGGCLVVAITKMHTSQG